MQALLILLQTNSVAIALVVYAVLDLSILLNPKLASNGLVHLLLSAAAAKAGVTLPGNTPPKP